jgi:hypothetical protein
MTAQSSVNGMALGGITAGAVLVYAGLRGVNPLAGLREIVSGRPGAVSTAPAFTTTAATGAGSVAGDALGVVGSTIGAGGGQGAALVVAAQQFAGDRYSQARRWQDGYSDCSSFVGKAFKAIGIAPPPLSVTTTYLAWTRAVKIPRAQLQGGDLCVNTAHMVLAAGANSAIGQENPRDNVQRGTPEQLMGTSDFVCLRYRWPQRTGHPTGGR